MRTLAFVLRDMRSYWTVFIKITLGTATVWTIDRGTKDEEGRLLEGYHNNQDERW
jgi:hypothetical protein